MFWQHNEDEKRESALWCDKQVDDDYYFIRDLLIIVIIRRRSWWSYNGIIVVWLKGH